jgi:glutaminyl-peptide cyclotransferase
MKTNPNSHSTINTANSIQGGRLIFVLYLLLVTCLSGCGPSATQTEAADKFDGAVAKLSPTRAIESIKTLCAIGPRFSGSAGMVKQQELLEKKFTELGGKIFWQPFTVRSPLDGQPVEMKNLIVQYFPERTKRVLIAAHYDTRPFPDRDPTNPRGIFVGANDGASGVALLIELAHLLNHASKNAPDSIAVGVDLVLFDGEELVYQEGRDDYFLGSIFFAREYLASPPGYTYNAGVLVDMIGDADLSLYYEENSLKYAINVTKELWKIAAELKLKEFKPKLLHAVRDDHLPLNEIAKIPTCDIIDLDYNDRIKKRLNYWHTTQDTPDKCSGDSILKVASVVWVWIQRQKP